MNEICCRIVRFLSEMNRGTSTFEGCLKRAVFLPNPCFTIPYIK